MDMYYTISNGSVRWFGSRVSNSNCLKKMKLKPNRTEPQNRELFQKIQAQTIKSSNPWFHVAMGTVRFGFFGLKLNRTQLNYLYQTKSKLNRL